MVEISLVVPTRNRPQKLRQTLASLREQTLGPDHYEVLIVDDGSEPPVEQPTTEPPDHVRILRIAHGERSTARNHGVASAAGKLLVFVDDDMILAPGFLESHQTAQREWPGALAVGAVSLPQAAITSPFGRFRSALEARGMPEWRGRVDQPNFCTATNMSLSRDRFLALGGFDSSLASAEDQDLALRHTATGGLIAFVPEAAGVHDDESLDIRSYCLRTEWGAENMIPFIQKHPQLPANRLRWTVNGPANWGQDPIALLGRKVLKAALAQRPQLDILFAVTSVLEQRFPHTRALETLYGVLVGIHLQRGFRRGWLSAGSPAA